ncbi:MAG: FAD-dependent oxidoreductase [Gammaproteobacteria bacterium]|nr:FAD-dependent oxidoreductase [Gammaproteobacteria bacterium]
MPAIGEETAAETRRNRHDPPIVVIGTGPVGMRMVLELNRQDPACRIQLFGNEPWLPYDRVKLSSFLAGEIAHEEINGNCEFPDNPQIDAHYNEAVTRIDRASKTVTTRYGNIYPYRYLVIATGSQPQIPTIQGVGLQGVYTFRDMTDTHRLFARKTRSRHTLILGGGLLGLECAKAMRRFNTRVTVIEQHDHLMFRQLDRTGSSLLKRHVETLGIKVIIHDSVRQILGTLGVQGVELRSGRTLRCDTVILATGISPNIDLAREAGLQTKRGILVDDCMQTSDPCVFAVGECAEHRGEIYGLVAPGYEQTAVVARRMAGQPAKYTGSIAMTSLKVVGCPLFCIGDTQQRYRDGVDPSFIDEAEGIYRKLIMDRGRLKGLIALGAWHEIPRLREILRQGNRVRPWQLWRFRRTGAVWRGERRASYFKPSMG